MDLNGNFGFYYYKAFVTKVYDGDTVTLDIDLGLNVFKKNQKVRLLGINTPEIRGEERKMGLISKDRLSNMILNKEIVIQTHYDKSGKYGRWLAIVWFFDESWINVNDLLISEGLAEEYLK